MKPKKKFYVLKCHEFRYCSTNFILFRHYERKLVSPSLTIIINDLSSNIGLNTKNINNLLLLQLFVNERKLNVFKDFWHQRNRGTFHLIFCV